MRDKIQKILNGTLATFIYLFAWEMFEEAVEEGIAFGITTLITKTVSMVFVISVAQGLKITIKKIIKSITYKEGNDKMKILKYIFRLLNSNKISLALSGTSIAALADALLGSPVLTDLFLNLGIDVVPLWAKSLVYLVVIIGTLVGVKWEKVKEYSERVEAKKQEHLRTAQERERIEKEKQRELKIAQAKELYLQVEEAKKFLAQEGILEPKSE